VTNKNYKSKA